MKINHLLQNIRHFGIFIILLVGLLGATVVQAHSVQEMTLSSIQHLRTPNADKDGDGVADDSDLDDDNDGIPDDVEGCLPPLEYNQFGFAEGLLEVSYHGLIAKTTDGYAVWGGSAAPATTDGNAANDDNVDLYAPTEITPSNGYTYTGTIKDTTTAAAGDTDSDQYFVLTTEGLYTWGKWRKSGYHRVTLHYSMYSVTDGDYAPFQQIALPSGVSASDIKSIDGTATRLALLTNNGEIWIAGHNIVDGSGELYADGDTSDDAEWHHVHLADPNDPTEPGDILTGIIQIKLASGNAVALDSSGNLWTWGVGTNDGDDTTPVDRQYPTQMMLPSGASVIQAEITARNRTHSNDDGSSASRVATYFVLDNDGTVYVLGQNTAGILGIGQSDFTYYQSSWTPLRNSDNTDDMTDVRFISMMHHSAYTVSGSLITNDGTLYEWGSNDRSKIGQPWSSSSDDSVDFVTLPTIPGGFVSGRDHAMYVATGGHLVPYFGEDGRYYNVGHKEEGGFGDGTSGDDVIDEYEPNTDVPDNLIVSQLGGSDTDNDGCPNCRDLDSDNDGISDLIESGLDPALDLTGGPNNTPDGMVDSTTDDDADGLMETVDADDTNKDADPSGVITSSNIQNSDSSIDDIPNFKDLDSDGDSIPDAVEAQPTSGYQGNDGDVSNNTNDCMPPYEVNAPEDTDGDGTPDYIDEDSDNDGVNDATESGLSPVLTGNDNDDDGIDDGVGASYQDPDGSASPDNSSTINLKNEDGYVDEVDYRSVDSLVAIGNRVWHDADKDGSMDDNEEGIDGIRIRLYKNTNDDGVCDPSSDTEVSLPGDYRKTSDGGHYKFTALMPSSDDPTTYYCVVIAKTDIPSQYKASSPGWTENPDASDENAGATLVATAANDDSTQGDDGYPSNDYVVSKPLKATLDGQQGSDQADATGYSDKSSYFTVDFGFHTDNDPANAVSLKSAQSSSSNAVLWGGILLALSVIGLAGYFKRRQQVH